MALRSAQHCASADSVRRLRLGIRSCPNASHSMLGPIHISTAKLPRIACPRAHSTAGHAWQAGGMPTWTSRTESIFATRNLRARCVAVAGRRRSTCADQYNH